MVSYAGKWRGHIHSGSDISRHEIDEFVDSCIAAGWDSVAVASGGRILRKWRRAS